MQTRFRASLEQMISYIRILAVIGTFALGTGALGQSTSEGANAVVQISGRLMSKDGVPISGRELTFRKLEQDSVRDTGATTDEKGNFRIEVARRASYQIYLSRTKDGTGGIGTIYVAGASGVALGDIALSFKAPNDPVVDFLGPIKLNAHLTATNPSNAASIPSKLRSIAAIFISCGAIPHEFCRGGRVHVILADGKEFQPPKEKDQVSADSPTISEDGHAAGWLIDEDVCCQSYPLSMKLIIYRPGKPLLGFDGDGRGIFGWHFVKAGKQFAFFQSFAHGEPMPHYELHEVETGRLLEQWNDGDGPESKEPEWVKNF